MADLAVLTADFFACPEEEIKQLESVLTMVDGRVVYEAGNFGKLAPPPLPVSPDWAPVAVYGGYAQFSAQPPATVASCCSHNHLHTGRHGYTKDPFGWDGGCSCFVF